VLACSLTYRPIFLSKHCSYNVATCINIELARGLRIGGWSRTTTAVIWFEVSCLGSLIVVGVSPLLTWFPWCLSRHKVVPQQRLRSWRRNCKRLKWCFEPSKPRFGQLLPCTPGRTWNRAREMKAGQSRLEQHRSRQHACRMRSYVGIPSHFWRQRQPYPDVCLSHLC
jgi:hypothetical protein